MNAQKFLAAAIAVLGIAAAFASTAAAAPTAPVPHGTVTLLAENASLSPQRETWFGLHFVLEPGWHTYWVNPGDAGTAPKLTWKLPAGFQRSEFLLEHGMLDAVVPRAELKTFLVKSLGMLVS